MGVDFYACKNCGETFPDCGYFVGCECGEHWCSEDCAEADGYQIHECDNEGCVEAYCEHEDESSCNFCRKEDFEDSELLNFCMDLLNVNRKELIQDFKKYQQGKC